VTGRHQLITEHQHYNARPIYVSGFYVAQVLFFIIECAIACFYLMFGHHPQPVGYPCAKFHFCRGPHCSASPWRKITYSVTHSLNHSLSHIIWCAGNRSFHFGL